MVKQVVPAQANASPQISTIPAMEITPDAEWLESDGLGGFASGPVLGA